MSAAAESPGASHSRLKRPATVAAVHSVEQEEGAPLVYLAPLPGGPMVVLRGTASLIWQEALDGPESTLVDRVAQRVGTGEEAKSIEADVVAFVEGLLVRGLLERVAAPGTEVTN
jgi:Coenzyme PQQ synthesis protein D (PqqD)